MPNRSSVDASFGFYINKEDNSLCIAPELMESVAMYSLSKTAFKLFFMMISARENDISPIRTSISFLNSRRFNICTSSSTFVRIKKELVEKGLLNQISEGGAGLSAVFEFSDRWKLYGTNEFIDADYISGKMGSM